MKAIHTSAVFSAAVMLAAPIAHAQVRFELGAGMTQYRTIGDGVWYQEAQPHTLNLRAPMVTAGLTGPIYTREKWGIDWHADYVNLGHTSSECMCTPMDENYNAASHQRLYNFDVPDVRFSGNGNAQGVALTVEPYVNYRDWRFGVEGGLFLHRAAFDVKVYDWMVEGSRAAGPQTIEVGTSHKINRGAVAGVSVGRGNWRVSYKHYWMPVHSEYPPLWKSADVLELKYVF